MADSPSRLTLPRSRRLRTGRDFSRPRTDGKRLVLGCLILNWLPLESGGVSRLGVVTSKKVGGAVIRNRCRRLMREVYRLHQLELAQPMDLVMVARPSMANKTFGQIERDFLTAMRQSRLWASPAQ
ncbi:MAG: ribonuclease P protein component [Verrucomicrobiota bacterium]